MFSVPIFRGSSIESSLLSMAFYIYILYSESHDKYYIGQTNDLNDRIRRHNCGFEKFTAPYGPWALKCVIEKSTRGEAILLERKLKNLNKEKLIRFINKYSASGPRRGFAGLGADL
jgi:putative endonuclease